MTEMTLAATVRHGTGKGVARKLRRAGQVPGIVYGVGDPVAIQFDAHEAGLLVHTLRGSERLISLQLADGGGKTAQRHVLLKAVQATPVGQHLLHIDFHEVDVTKTVHVAVEVVAEGKAAGEKQGGILQQITREVDVECLPTIIPESLRIDVSALEIGDSLHVRDLPFPDGVTPLTAVEETLFVVAAPRVEEEAAAEGEELEGEEAGAAEAAEAPAEQDEAEGEA